MIERKVVEWRVDPNSGIVLCVRECGHRARIIWWVGRPAERPEAQRCIPCEIEAERRNGGQ